MDIQGEDDIVREYFAQNFRGGISPPLQVPKLTHTASRTHCTANAPRFRQGKISPPSLETKSSFKIIRV